jgi:putative transposase
MGQYNPEIHQQPSPRFRQPGRRSVRLKGHDYAGGGLYFVTLCAHREAGNLFADEAVKAAVEECWRSIPEHFPNAEAKTFVVMPDHVHGLIQMAAVGANDYSSVRGGERPKGTSRTLGSVIRGFKIGVTKWVRRGEKSFARTAGADAPIWQRNYYEMIVRSAEAEKKIADYIRMNPWKCVQNFGSGLRGIGNPALWNGRKLGVLCSRNAPYIGRIPKADVYFGGWHSPKEREIFDWLLRKKQRVIACPAWGIEGARQASSVLEALEGNRILILEMRNQDGDLAAAEARNRFVVECADELFVPYTSPGGMLERIFTACQT